MDLGPTTVDLGQVFSSLLGNMMEFLTQTAHDPVTYSIVFFIYTVLATIILPLPVEVGLLLSPVTPFLWLALILGLGKMVGSALVFYLGLGIGGKMRSRTDRPGPFKWLMEKSELVVDKLHYLGLYLILAIPIMPDTIPLYIFSVLNEHGVFRVEWFALINFLAGITRATILFSLLYLFGVDLFH
jgi:membrane protein YqaA with SNARE-associated domain